MQWLLGLSLFLLCLRPNAKAMLIGAILYLLTCIFMSRRSKSLSITRSMAFYIKPCLNSVLSLLIVLAAVYRFYTAEPTLGLLSSAVAWLGLSVPKFMRIAGCFLFVPSYLYMRWLIECLLPAEREGSALKWNARSAKPGIRSQLFLFGCAFIVISICSKSSPLYPLNDWQDANCFFTVGKSMLSGGVPYRDLMEQKGPFLYALHALTALVSYESFVGVWLLEIICCYAFLVYSYKTFLLFDGSRSTILLIPVAAALVYTCPAFAHGDSAEELCLPILSYAYYVGFKSLALNKLPSAKEGFVIGLTSACVLWTKYTMLGFYIGWFFLLSVFAFRNKEYKALLRMTAAIAAGVIVVTIPVLLYFFLNGAIRDLWEVYFYNNIVLYRIASPASPDVDFVINLSDGLKHLKTDNGLSVLAVTISIILTAHKRMKNAACLIATAFGFLWVSVYVGGRNYVYYAFIFSVFAPLGILLAWQLLKRAIPGFRAFLNKRFRMTAAASLCVCLLLSLTSGNTYLMLTPKAEMPQYRFKRVIEESGITEPTLLNYGFLDGGFYTTTGIVPHTKYFCRLGIFLTEMLIQQDRYAENGIPDFIVTCGEKPEEFSRYTPIDSAPFDYEGGRHTYWLYKRSDR